MYIVYEAWNVRIRVFVFPCRRSRRRRRPSASEREDPPSRSLHREREDDSFRLDSTLPAEIIYHGNGT
jgi:hypothetical protein